MIQSDKKLIQLFIEGNPDAQKYFIEKYKNWIVGIAIKKFKLDIFNAEEIFQMLLLNLIERDYHVLKSWQGHGKFSTYLTVIVTRICIKYVNKDKNNDSLDEQNYANNAIDESKKPEEFAEISSQLNLIQTHFITLNARDQLLLSYRYVDELTAAEIGEILNMKAATVRKAIHDALHRLRNKLPINVTLIILTALIGKYK